MKSVILGDRPHQRKLQPHGIREVKRQKIPFIPSEGQVIVRAIISWNWRGLYYIRAVMGGHKGGPR